MSIRCLWIISPRFNEKVIYARKFPTVEQRARRFGTSYYVPVPPEEDFASYLLHRLELDSTVEFDPWRDNCQLSSHVPVLEVKTDNGILWPVVVIEQMGLFFCCLGLEKESSTDLPLYQVPSIAIGFSILTNIINQLGTKALKLSENAGFLMELDQYIRTSLPFGRLAALDNVPPPASRSKPRLFITVETAEYLKCIQHARLVDTVLEVSGTVALGVDLEESQMLNLRLTPPSDFSLALSPAVKTSRDPTSGEYRLEAQVPAQQSGLNLAIYAVYPNDLPPIIGAYQLLDKGENSVELFLKLNLSRGVRNSFDVLEVFIPFYLRGKLALQNLTPTIGALQLNEERTAITWKIGQFPKNMEATLWGSVQFNPQDGLVPHEPFVTESNTFVEITFVQTGTTWSGCRAKLDGNSPSRVKVNTVCRTTTQDYRIWNDNGEIPFVPKPKLND